ncbi:MAG: ATP-binding protein [bacterium]
MAKFRTLNLRSKLILIISGIILPLMISSLSIISFLINRASFEFLKQDLFKTTTALDELKSYDRQHLKLVCDYVAQKSDLPKYLSAGSAKQVSEAAGELVDLFGVTYVAIQNDRHEIVFQSPAYSGIDLKRVTSLSMRSRRVYGLVSNDRRIYEIAAFKLNYRGRLAGYVTVGINIGARQARIIRKITNSDISFLVGETIVASTLSDKSHLLKLSQFFKEHFRNPKPDRELSRRLFTIGREKYLINLLPLKNIQGSIFGYFAVQRSTERILNFNKGIKNALFIIIVAFWLCTGIVVGIFIQRHLVQPIGKLADAVDAIAKGDLSPNLEIQSNDEIGSLYTGFNHMASEVRSWTGKLTEKNKELKRHSQKIEEVNQEMQDFVYVVSHDLKSPLVNIQGFTGRLSKLIDSTKSKLVELNQTLQLDENSNGSKEQVQEIIKGIESKGPQSFEFIHQASKKMNDMIEELLALSRVETRNMPIEPADLGAEIDSIIKAVKYEIQEKDIKVEVDPMPTVVCEKARINQVFTNLITNAIKFIGDKPQKKIRVGYQDAGDYHQFLVEDNGVGINPKDHKKIFRVFYRGDTRISGHGMGLALAKKIVMKHEGRIWLESEAGKGSKFYFTIKKQVPNNQTVSKAALGSEPVD